MIVALAGVFAERSGIINIALEGIMIIGAFIGVLFVNPADAPGRLQRCQRAGTGCIFAGLVLLAMLVAAASARMFSLLLSLCLHKPAGRPDHRRHGAEPAGPRLVLFFIRIIANQNTLNMASGDRPAGS